METRTPFDFARLTPSLAGRLMLATEEAGPEAVLFAASLADVTALIGFARRSGLRVLPRHMGPVDGDLRGAVVVRTTSLREVSVDAAARTVRVGAGATWGSVGAALEPFGMLALAGSGPDCGVVGPLLDGGFGWLGRRHGLAAASVTAVELVTGDGVARRVDEQHDADLFWALRGGATALGVVTAVEFEARRHDPVHAGELAFPLTRAAEVLAAWAGWTATLDDGTTSRAVVGAATRLEVAAATADAVRPLRALGPLVDTVAATLVSPWPVKVRRDVGGTLLLDDLDEAAVEAIVAAGLPVEVQHLGGALGRPDPRLALQRIPGRFLLRVRTPVGREADARVLLHALGRLEHPFSVAAETAARLERVREAADPARVLLR